MAEDKKPLIIRRTIEEVVEFLDELTLENVDIAGTNYDLKLINANERLTLEFYNKNRDNNLDFRMLIDGEGIRFERFFSVIHLSPNLSDVGYETLQERTDDSRPGPKKGERMWRERFPYQGEGYKHFHIPFGARRDDYSS